MDGGDLAEFGEKNVTQIMIFLPHYMWVENKKEKNQSKIWAI